MKPRPMPSLAFIADLIRLTAAVVTLIAAILRV
ncbi:hypothetical protein ABIB58_000548 [Brevundimonas sp. UYEF29]